MKQTRLRAGFVALCAMLVAASILGLVVWAALEAEEHLGHAEFEYAALPKPIQDWLVFEMKLLDSGGCVVLDVSFDGDTEAADTRGEIMSEEIGRVSAIRFRWEGREAFKCDLLTD